MGNSVTKMKSIILLICTLAAIASANPFRGVITLKDLSEANCDGAQCPGGCCPADNYVCCEGGYFCGATLADCPMVIQKDEVHAKELEQECEGEVCNFYFTIVKNYGNLWINGEPDVIEDGEEKEANQDCDGTVCPGGCCPNAGWFCCPGDEYCAASEEYCKKTDVAQKLITMAAPKRFTGGYGKIVKQDCEGTVCPGGCCPNAGWFCCPGDEYCAASEEYCKKTNFAQKMISMAVKLQ